MNWDKAKNLTIICLLILNIVLLTLVYANNRQYITTKEEKEAIYTVLSQNNITLNSPFIEKFEPKESINMSEYDYDSSLLESAFFGTTDLIQTSEGNKIIFKNYDENKELIIDGNLVYFKCKTPTNSDYRSDVPIYEAKAVEMGDKFISENKVLFPDFTLDRSFDTGRGFQLEYRQIFKDNIIYSNYAIINISYNGEITLEYVFNPPLKFDNNPEEIISSDQALFIFLREAATLTSGDQIVIEKMDVVYHKQYQENGYDNALIAVPCYRFYVEGVDAPLLINAYTGNIESEF